jgi:uncharacterized protein (TIGR02246 family)
MSILTHALLTIAAALPAAVLTSCNKSGAGSETNDIIAMERAALDRWGQGDTQGVLDLYAKDITYFDPFQDKRVDGLEAMKALYRPFAGKFKILHYEMIDPKVQRTGEVAVLTYNLLDDFVELSAGPTSTKMAWNVTSVYARVEGQWRIVHSHYSFVKAAKPTLH